MSAATINGFTCTRVRVQLPSWGVWYADVEVAGEHVLAGAVELVLADAALSGTVIAGGAANGRSAYRIAGGAGRWGATVARRAYANDLGVRRSVLAEDVARDVGESVDEGGLEGAIGPAFTRANDRAAAVLDAIAPRAWRVDADGTTRFGARTTVAIATVAPRVRVDPKAGVLTIASSEIAALVPGVSVDGVVAVDVEHDLDERTGLRTTLYASPWGASREAEALRRFVRAVCPELRWSGVHEYRVGMIEAGGARLALQPVRSVHGLPDLRFVRVRPGVFGASATPALGALCLVAFVDSDPARPVVVAGDDPDSPGFLPVDAALDASGSVAVGASADLVELGSGSDTVGTSTGRVVRYGDTVVYGGGGGPGVLTVGPGTPFARVSA